jgi:hypothetical protein
MPKKKLPVTKLCHSSNNKLLTEDRVRDLAHIQCTYKEIAACCRCSEDTLRNHFSSVITNGWEEGKESLRRAQYKKAMEGNPSMLIWCGKHTLKQRDVIEVSNHKTDVENVLDYIKNASQSDTAVEEKSQ